MAEITITDHRDDRPHNPYDFGVWVDGKPAGRITIREEGFAGYTNKREPGKALLGVYATRDEAAEVVASFREGETPKRRVEVHTRDGDDYIGFIVRQEGQKVLIEPSLETFGGAVGDPIPEQLEPRWVDASEVGAWTTPEQREAIAKQAKVYDTDDAPDCRGLKQYRVYSAAAEWGEEWPADAVGVDFAYIYDDDERDPETCGLETTIFAADGSVIESQDFG